MSYIIRSKPGSNQSLTNEIRKRITDGETNEFKQIDEENGILRKYRFVNDVPLNKTYPNIRVNYLDYQEVDENGKDKEFQLDY